MVRAVFEVVDGPVLVDAGFGPLARNVSDGTTAHSEVWDAARHVWVRGSTVGDVLMGVPASAEDLAAAGLTPRKLQ